MVNRCRKRLTFDFGLLLRSPHFKLITNMFNACCKTSSSWIAFLSRNLSFSESICCTDKINKIAVMFSKRPKHDKIWILNSLLPHTRNWYFFSTQFQCHHSHNLRLLMLWRREKRGEKSQQRKGQRASNNEIFIFFPRRSTMWRLIKFKGNNQDKLHTQLGSYTKKKMLRHKTIKGRERISSWSQYCISSTSRSEVKKKFFLSFLSAHHDRVSRLG